MDAQAQQRRVQMKSASARMHGEQPGRMGEQWPQATTSHPKDATSPHGSPAAGSGKPSLPGYAKA